MIKRYRHNLALKRQIKSIASGVRNTRGDQKIVFCPLNDSSVNTIRESLMGLACQQRGATVGMLYLDTHLPQSEYYSTNLERFVYKRKTLSNAKFTKKIGLSTFRTSDFETSDTNFPKWDQKTVAELEYRGVLIGDLAVASTVRAFLSNGPEWENPLFMEKLEKSLESAIILIDTYSNFIDQEKPDKLVMSHGIYISWGTLFRLARSRNIPVDCYGSSYRKNTLRFYHNSPNAPFPIAEWPRFETKELTNDQNELLDHYISGRETQKDDNIRLFDEDSNIPEKLRNFMKENESKKVFCLFSNIAWDAFAFGGSEGFPTMMDWITETVTHFNEHPEAALIIKAHPAEIYWKTPGRYRVRTFVNKLNVNDNILLIGEDENVKPFWLYDKIDVGLIHISTVAIEMALKGIPVLTSGANGHYSNKGFTIDPASSKEYFQQLDSLISNENAFQPNIDAARKYMFYRFFREAIEFDVIELENLFKIKHIRLRSAEDLKEGSNTNLDIICDGILKNTTFVNTYE